MRSVFIALVLCALSFAAHAEDNQKTIRVGVFTWPGNGTLFVGNDKKFFGDVAVEIKVIDDTAALAGAFRSGQIDVMSNSLDGIALLAGNGTQAKVFLATDNSFGSDGIVANDKIANVKELKGKKVGFVQGIFQHFFLNQILKLNGMTIADIQPVTFDDPSMAGQALLSGKVDAAVAWEPFLSQTVKQKKGHIIASTKLYPGIYANVLLISDKALISKPEAVKSFVSGVEKSIQYTEKNKDEAATIMAKGFNMKKDDVLDTMKGLVYLTPKDNVNYFCAEKLAAAAVFNEASAFWAEQKLVKQPKDAKDYMSVIGCDIFKSIAAQ